LRCVLIPRHAHAVAFLSPAHEQQLNEAIAEVEARSRAELVVVVRPASGDYLGNDMLVASGAALAMLAFQLYSQFEFALHWMLIDPPLMGAATVALLRAIPGLRAMFVSEARMRDAVATAAAACFHHKGIRHTRERTGILVYVSLFEGMVVVLPDSGISRTIPADVWRDAVQPIEVVLRDEGDAGTLATRLRGLGDVLARWCERRGDDVDELPNRVEVSS
jgi:putative membrane protein